MKKLTKHSLNAESAMWIGKQTNFLKLKEANNNCGYIKPIMQVVSMSYREIVIENESPNSQ